MSYEVIFQSQKEFFNSQRTKDLAFRKEKLKWIKRFM